MKWAGFFNAGQGPNDGLDIVGLEKIKVPPNRFGLSSNTIVRRFFEKEKWTPVISERSGGVPSLYKSPKASNWAMGLLGLPLVFPKTLFLMFQKLRFRNVKPPEL